MKITSIPVNIYKNKSAKYNTKPNNQNINPQNNELINNSLTEIIGRSRVIPFKGKNFENGEIFEHKCSNIYGEKEVVFYNKTNGSFIHKIFMSNGTLKKQEEFRPNEQTEIYTEVDKSGEKTTTIYSPNKHSIEKTNALGDVIYLEENNPNGAQRIEITDYEKKRKIIKETANNKKSTKVIDLKTMQYVTSGDLILEQIYDKQNKILITQNIITGQTLKKEKYINGQLEFSVEYSQITGNPIKEIHAYNNRTYNEINFNDDGAIQSKIEYQFTKEGILERKIIQKPAASKKFIYDKIIKFSNEKDYIVYSYKQEPNIIQTKYYYKNEKLEKEIHLANDGKTFAFQIEYNKDNSFTKIYYDINGKERKIEYNSDGTRKNRNNFNIIIDEDRETKEDFIARILNLLSLGAKAELQSEDWQRLSDITGVEDCDSLKQMTHKLYRQLSIKFSPDSQGNTDKKLFYQDIAKVLNNLYQK